MKVDEEKVAEGFVKKIKFWALLAFAIGSAGWATAMFTTHKASAEDLSRLKTSFEEHLIDDASHKATDEQRYQDIQENMHYMRDQIDRVADAVGAPKPSRFR